MDLGLLGNIETKYFNFFDRITDEKDLQNVHFRLHNHDFYEIYLFLEGDANYIIEDKSYPLEPYDLVVIKKNELHQVFHNSNKQYHRSFLWIDSRFFEKHDCSLYEEKFLNSSFESGSKIPANIVLSSGIYDVFTKFKKYTNEYIDAKSPVIESLVVELLHLIHEADAFELPKDASNSIQSIITYLNQNFTQNISLDMLQKDFYISKYHLCRKFKEATGLSVHEYIRKKRLAKAKELKAEGVNLKDVAIQSGFSDYSSFYRAYLKEFHCTPKK